MFSFIKRILVIVVVLLCCINVVNAQRVSVTYKESNADFPNPERGFYTSAGRSGSFTKERFISNRTESKKYGSATYAVYSTLLERGYNLDSFLNKPLPDSFIQMVDKELSIVRDAGIKVILRFAYTFKSHSGTCPDKEKICPPYGDASKEMMLQHIAQLKPVLQKNADVIAVLQEGFIGIWGENYYTDHFGDASANGEGKINDVNWKDRNDILKALLDALPQDRMIQVRTPQIKQKFIYGPHATVESKPTNEAGAFNFSDNARIGFHNDCFLASIDDYGTFYDYGSSVSPKKPANETMRKYFEEDSQYGPVGGETCDDAFSPGNDCAPIGHAEAEMASMHYSFLNTTYNNNVNNDWDSLGCISSIKKNLGYRFVLKNADLPSRSKPGADFNFTINLENKGYSSPYNPRSLQLVLRNQQTGKEYAITCKTDVRRWFSGSITWKESIKLPTDIAAGKYELLLNLPDKYPSLAGRPEYSIQLANENTWEEKTGYNKLNHLVTVSL